jgi:5'-nucleotidase
VAAGGVAYLASAIDNLRAQNPNHAVVSAGDMIGATPINSALFLDEPTILGDEHDRRGFQCGGQS